MVISALSKTEVKALYDKGGDAVWRHIEKLQKEKSAYERRLNLNSSNSSKPSSTDSVKQKSDNKNNRKNNSREKTDRKIGGQAGHEGSTRNFAESPDEIISHPPDECPCGYRFDGIELELKTERRQVIDIPKPSVKISEHQVLTCQCPKCGTEQRGSFPPAVKAPVQYGNNLHAYVIYLMVYQLLPYKRSAELLNNFYNLNISQGTLRNILTRAAEKFKPPVEAIKQELLKSAVIHFDESGLYVEGGRDWLHVASNADLTFYFHHHSRGIEAIDAANILPLFEGIACHDNWSPYYHYACQHSLCNAHHLRDLEDVFESYGYEWSKDMQNFLRSANTLVKMAKARGQTQLPPGEITALQTQYQYIIDEGYKQTPPPPERRPGQKGRLAKGKALNLLERFDHRRHEILDFIEDFTCSFDNNQAERDVRMIKVKQKISGTFRSGDMAQGFCILRSFISTAVKQGCNVFDAIENGLTGKFFISAQA